jgi:hypothetical protein
LVASFFLLCIGLAMALHPAALLASMKDVSRDLHHFLHELRGQPWMPLEEPDSVPDSPKVRMAMRLTGSLLAAWSILHLVLVLP